MFLPSWLLNQPACKYGFPVKVQNCVALGKLLNFSVVQCPFFEKCIWNDTLPRGILGLGTSEAAAEGFTYLYLLLSPSFHPSPKGPSLKACTWLPIPVFQGTFHAPHAAHPYTWLRVPCSKSLGLQTLSPLPLAASPLVSLLHYMAKLLIHYSSSSTPF